MTTPEKPSLAVEFEPRFCGANVVDLTIGCSFGCIYCPFADASARRHGFARPTSVALEALDRLAAPASVFLSPASDPFSPQAAPATHALLEHLFPRGTTVGILTKGVIPDHTLDLLAAHRGQVEGIAVGLSSLDAARNHALEPGAPPAEVRLSNLLRIAVRGLPAALRMDPLLPDLDDLPDALRTLVREGARRGARAVTATYVFAWGRYLRQLRNEPLTAPSSALLVEKAPMEGGQALSVPLARKLATYSRIAEFCREHGMIFNTCGCKDLRVRAADVVTSACGNPAFPRSCPATPHATHPAADT